MANRWYLQRLYGWIFWQLLAVLYIINVFIIFTSNLLPVFNWSLELFHVADLVKSKEMQFVHWWIMNITSLMRLQIKQKKEHCELVPVEQLLFSYDGSAFTGLSCFSICNFGSCAFWLLCVFHCIASSCNVYSTLWVICQFQWAQNIVVSIYVYITYLLPKVFILQCHTGVICKHNTFLRFWKGTARLSTYVHAFMDP